MKKIIKHSFCKLKNCPHIGLTGEIEETIVKPHTDKDGKQVEGEYWVRLENGGLGKFRESDLDQQEDR